MKVLRQLTDLNIFLSAISDEQLKDAISRYLEFHKYRVLNFPASIVYHHNWRGGLFDHTIEVCKIAWRIASMPMLEDKVSLETITAVCILHDLGKIFRYKEVQVHLKHSPTGFKYQRTDIDHAEAVVLDFMQQTGFILPMDICLCILSHDGGYTKSSVHPNTLEASIIASADMISSRINVSEWKL